LLDTSDPCEPLVEPTARRIREGHGVEYGGVASRRGVARLHDRRLAEEAAIATGTEPASGSPSFAWFT
jgi:hypothetical protein